MYLAAADKKMVDGLVAVFMRIGLEPERMEPELIPTSRAIVIEKKYQGASVVCVMGAMSVGIGVFENDQLLFVYKSSSGGVSLTRAIVSGLQLSVQQAEEYKRTYGLTQNLLEGKLIKAMKPVFDSIVGDLKRTISYYNQTYPGGQVGRILLTGGTALMPGLVPWLSAQVGVEVLIGDPFEGLEVPPQFAKLGAVYASVIGAAYKE